MRKTLLTLFLVVFIDLVGFGILLPNQQYYGELFGIRNTFFLVLIGPAYSLFQFVFAPILGRWSDRAGRRPVLILSQCGTLVGFLLLFGSHFIVGINQPLAIFLLYFSRALDGISGGNISIAFAYVADVTTPENRAKGMGLVGAALGGGFVLGPFIGGVVGEHIGLAWVPLSAAIISVTALTCTILFLPESLPAEKRRTAKRAAAPSVFHATLDKLFSMRHALAKPVIGGLIAMVFVNGFAFAGMEQTFSLLIQFRAYPALTRSNPLAAAKAASGACGYLFGGIGIIIVLVQGGIIGRLTKAFGEAALAIAGPLLIAVGLLIVGSAGIWGPVWTSFIVGSAFLAFGSSIFNPSIQSLISRHAAAEQQGEVLGASQGMASLARGLGPLLAGALFAFVWVGTGLAGSAPYYFSAALSLVVVVWAIAVRRKVAPPAKAAADSQV
jgi:DHA1 family tetracycline resistance protein-like MFS transporter